MRFDFSDKESYLAWRQKWKADYATLSQDIRNRKRRLKQFIRTYERYQTTFGWARRLISKSPNPEYGSVGNLHGLQMQATFMLEQLKEARALSWKLKQARLAGETIPQPTPAPQPVPDVETPTPSLLTRLRRWVS